MVKESFNIHRSFSRRLYQLLALATILSGSWSAPLSAQPQPNNCERWYAVTNMRGHLTVTATGSGHNANCNWSVNSSAESEFEIAGIAPLLNTSVNGSGNVSEIHDMCLCPTTDRESRTVRTGSGALNNTFGAVILLLGSTPCGYNLFLAETVSGTVTRTDCDGSETTSPDELSPSWSLTAYYPGILAGPLPEFGRPITGTVTQTVPYENGSVTVTVSWSIVPVIDDSEDEPCPSCGSVVGIENQSLGQAVPIVGAPFSLHYQSDRITGSAGANALQQGLGGWTLSVRHAYDPAANTLHFGDGSRRNSSSLGPVSPRDTEIPGVVPSGGYLIAAVDGSEVYAFDSTGRHLRTVDALTAVPLYRFQYDTTGKLKTIRDTFGNPTSIERNTNGQPVAIIAPNGQRTPLCLDPSGYLASIANAANETNRFTYTAEGILTAMTDPKNYTYTYQYNAEGKLIREDDPAGGFKILDRIQATSGYSVALRTATGQTNRYSVEMLNDNSKTRTARSAAGRELLYNANASGRGIMQFPDGTVLKRQATQHPIWGSQSPLLDSISLQTPSGLQFTRTARRTITLSNPENPLSFSMVEEVFAVNGRPYVQHYAAAKREFSQTSPQERQLTASFDARGLVSAGRLGTLPSAIRHNRRGALRCSKTGTGNEATVSDLSCSASMLLERITDPLARLRRFSRDAAGRVITNTFFDGRQARYAYDAKGNVTMITPPGRPTHAFAYSPVDLRTHYSPPAVLQGRAHTEYLYDADRRLAGIIRPDGQTIQFEVTTNDGCNCNPLGSVTFARGTLRYAYDPASGNLISITAPGGITLNYHYDGSLLTNETWSGLISGTVSRTYDNDFRISSVTINNGDPIRYQYDNDNLLIRAGDLLLSRNAQSGLISGTVIGVISNASNYDSFGALISQTTYRDGTAIYTAHYTYDKLGRIIHKSDTIDGVPRSFRYGYDQAGRLSDVTRKGVTTARYTYDSNGNRVRATFTNTVINGAYDDQDRMISYGGTTYEYTLNGELRAKTVDGQTTDYRYDALGNLTDVTLSDGRQIEYLIDGRSRRIGKRVNGALVQGFVYQDLLKPVGELDGGGNVVSQFVYATRTNVPDYIVKEGLTYQIVVDHLGSPRLIMEINTGTIVQRIDYDEFGRVLVDSNPGFQPFGFAGGLYDADTALVRFGKRDYDYESGRWTIKDPERFSADEVNVYEYVLSDPVNMFDPDGRFLRSVAPQVQAALSNIRTTPTGEALVTSMERSLTSIDLRVESNLGTKPDGTPRVGLTGSPACSQKPSRVLVMVDVAAITAIMQGHADLGILAVLAHELGHVPDILAGHCPDSIEDPLIEARATATGHRILRELGLNP